MDSPALIQAARGGNLNAFNRLVLVYQDEAYTMVCHLMPGCPNAETLTKAAIMQVYKSFPEYTGNDFRLWVYAAALKACRLSLRDRRYRSIQNTHASHRDLLSSDSPLSDAPLPGGLYESSLDSCLGELAFELRAVLVLIDMHELDYSQAARVLGIPVRTVKSRLAKARQQLTLELLRMETD